MGAAKILIADDHEVVRRGLKEILEARPDWQICGEAATGRDALSKAKLLKPTVAVLDITMPDMNGLEATRQIVSAIPGTEILILTMHESEQIVRDVLNAGARGYVLKSDAGRELISAIESLTQHKPYFTLAIADLVLRGYLTRSKMTEAEKAHDDLSPREREIIQLLAEGKSNKEIASVLDISVKTAEAHRTNVMRKLRIHSISELVRYAIRNNIVAI